MMRMMTRKLKKNLVEQKEMNWKAYSKRVKAVKEE
jgi:hypothetical protein